MYEAGARSDLTDRLFESETEGHEMAVVVDSLHTWMIHPVQHPEQLFGAAHCLLRVRLDTEGDVELIEFAGPLREFLSHGFAALHPGARPAANGRLDQRGCSG